MQWTADELGRSSRPHCASAAERDEPVIFPSQPVTRQDKTIAQSTDLSLIFANSKEDSIAQRVSLDSSVYQLSERTMELYDVMGQKPSLDGARVKAEVAASVADPSWHLDSPCQIRCHLMNLISHSEESRKEVVLGFTDVVS